MKFTHIPRKRDQHKRRVAAYCRVSTLLAEQEESLEAQAAHYTARIAAHEDWEFAGIYCDERSGTKADNRPGFQQLIRDALEGRVDYILVKSISRFSRNIVDCQGYVKRLHGNGVDIHFEKEDLDTADPSCSMMLSFLSTIAQDESHSISENVKWAYRERFKRGVYNLGNNRILGYDSIDGRLSPNGDAEAVRMIFRLFNEGKGPEAIRQALWNLGIGSKNGKPLSRSGIAYILQNETYVGDKRLQKQAPKNYLTKQPEKNVEFDSYYLENDHEAIVDRLTWETAQSRMQQEQQLLAAVGHHCGGRHHFLYGKIFCGCCGAPMTRRTLTDSGGTHCKSWICRERRKGRSGNGCTGPTIREMELLDTLAAQLGHEITPADDLRAEITPTGVHIQGARASEP